jgi:hypothetical protein
MNKSYPERGLIKLTLLDLLWRQEGHQMKASESYRPLAQAVELDPRLAQVAQTLSDLDEMAPTWIHHVQWAGKELATDGYIETHVPYGIWKLTRKGAETAETLARVCAPL